MSKTKYSPGRSSNNRYINKLSTTSAQFSSHKKRINESEFKTGGVK